jgi:hypothetical protein
VSSISCATSVANLFPLFPLRLGERMAFVGVCRMWMPIFGDGWNNLQGHTHYLACMAPGQVVGDHPKERSQCVGTTTSTWAEKI